MTQPTVRNQLFSSAIRDLSLPCPCDLSQYKVQMQGVTQEGCKTVVVHLHACVHTPFQGPHKVSFPGEEPFWVQSLTALKKNFFGFVDSLSFERCMYLVVEGHLLRLQNIRFIATLPQQELQVGERVFRTPTDFSIKSRRKTVVATLSSHARRRRQLILTRCVEKLLRLYAKEGESSLQCMQTLTNDFQETCANVLSSMKPEETQQEEEMDASALMELDASLLKDMIDEIHREEAFTVKKKEEEKFSWEEEWGF
jgi:hypothetical protein